jgi:eukaryotic-like serine/threonine-protein kinase
VARRRLSVLDPGHALDSVRPIGARIPGSLVTELRAAGHESSTGDEVDCRGAYELTGMKRSQRGRWPQCVFPVRAMGYSVCEFGGMHQVGAYEVIGVLGEGGMSTVYEAEDGRSGRRVALKVLEAGIGASPRVRELFVAEMAILERINHPHVVSFLESMEVDGRLVTVLELLRGETLREAIRRRSRFAWPEAVSLLRQVLAGLSAAHSQRPPIVHRDLKPENIMITTDGTVKVMDFGIAKVIREGTRATTDVGTLEYMCPEQIEGLAIDQRADLYGVGLLLYELLTGVPPFRSQSTRVLLNAQCTAPPPPLPPVVAQSVPGHLVELMLQLLAKSPHERPSTAEEVLSRLDAIVLAPGPSAAGLVAPTVTASPSAPSVAPPVSYVAPAAAQARADRSRGSPAVAIVGTVMAVVLFASTVGWMVYLRYAAAGSDPPVDRSEAVAVAETPPVIVAERQERRDVREVAATEELETPDEPESESPSLVENIIPLRSFFERDEPENPEGPPDVDDDPDTAVQQSSTPRARVPVPKAPEGPLLTVSQAKKQLEPEVLKCLKAAGVHYVNTRMGNKVEGGVSIRTETWVPKSRVDGVVVSLPKTSLGRCINDAGRTVRTIAFKQNYVLIDVRNPDVSDPLGHLPSQPPRAEITALLAPRDDDVRACARKHNHGDTKIHIRLRVDGPSGKLSTARVNHAAKALDTCIEKLYRPISFPRARSFTYEHPHVLER